MTRHRIGLAVATLVALPIAALAGPVEKKVILDGSFGRIVSNTVSKPATPTRGEIFEIGQEVRIDPLTSADQDWDGAMMTVYEQNVASPGTATIASTA
jgi:hypothetical protein